MFLSVIRYFIGYVSFTATGNSIEHFFNLIARSGITVFNIKNFNKPKDEDGNLKKRYASLSVVATDYKLLRPLARKSGLKLKVSKKTGIPFILNKYKKRCGILWGIALLCLTLYILSLYIWVIKVEGNVTLSEENVILAAQEIGLKPGILKKYVNVREAEHGIMAHFPELSWVAVNVQGCFATISINESLKPPEILPKDQPCNIKASRSGQIVRMEVYKGNQEVKNGDAVVEGQLLVSGIVEDTFGGSSIEHACAKAIAVTKHELQEKVNLKSTKKVLSGKKKVKRRIHLFGLDVPVTLQNDPAGDFEVYKRTDVLKIGNVPLPISVYKEDFMEQVEKEEILTLEEAKNLAQAKLEETKKSEFENKKIIREDRKESFTDGVYFLNVTFYCEEDIATEEPLSLLTE